LEKYRQAFFEREKDVATTAGRLRASLDDEAARELVEKFERAHAEMGAGYRRGFQAFQRANFNASVGDAAVQGMDRGPAELLDEVSARLKSSSAMAVKRAAEASRQATFISSSLMLLVCALGIGGAVVISRTITRPINQA